MLVVLLIAPVDPPPPPEKPLSSYKLLTIELVPVILFYQGTL